MLQSTYHSFQKYAFSDSPLVRYTAIGLVLAAGALLIALFIGIFGPLIALALALFAR